MFLSKCRNVVLSQSARVFALGYFLIQYGVELGLCGCYSNMSSGSGGLIQPNYLQTVFTPEWVSEWVSEWVTHLYIRHICITLQETRFYASHLHELKNEPYNVICVIMLILIPITEISNTGNFPYSQLKKKPLKSPTKQGWKLFYFEPCVHALIKVCLFFFSSIQIHVLEEKLCEYLDILYRWAWF